LVDFDADMKFIPQLAEAWEVAGDLKSVRFKLRANARFHDGTPVDAAAVKFNVERLVDKDRNPTNRPLWNPISAVEIVDPLTVVVRTSEPYAPILNSFAHASGSLVSPAAVQKFGEKGIAQNPVGAGPYRLENFAAGQEIALVAFDGYWAGKPPVERLVFKYVREAPTRIAALRTGAVDVIDAVPVQQIAALRRESGIQVITRPSLRPIGMAINMTRPPFDDLRVRHALNHAIPVQAIAERAFFGFAKTADSPLAFDTPGYRRAGAYPFSVDRAKALLAEAGFKPGAGGIVEREGKPLKLTLLASDGLIPGDVSVAEIAQSSFKNVGIDATIQKIEAGSYFNALRVERAQLTWDLAIFGFNPSNASGLYHMESLFKSNADDAKAPAVWNIGRYRNAKVDELLLKANTDPSPAARDGALGDAQKLVWDDAPYVWLYVPENGTATRAGVEGVELWPIVFTILRRARLKA
jgi:ABC-type transport system substrate-binding protein